MKQRWFWASATYAAVVATTLSVAFGQAPKTTPSPTAAEKFRRASAGKDLSGQDTPQERFERFRKWQEAQKAGKAGIAFDQPAGAMAFFLEKRLRAGETTLSTADYAPALEQAGDMPVYSTALD